MTQQSSSRNKQANTASDATHQVTGQVKETVGQVTEQAQQAAGQVVGQAREQVSSRLSSQKDRAAEGLTSVAQALRQTGQQLRDQDQQAVTGYIDTAASQVERISSYLRDNDLGGLIDDVERFARRQPALFLGGTFFLGLLGARFLKSSRPATRPGGYSGSTALAQRQMDYPSRFGARYPSAGTTSGARIYATSGPATAGTTTTPSSSSASRPRSTNYRPEE